MKRMIDDKLFNQVVDNVITYKSNYMHHISIVLASGRFSMLILNNSSTAFTNTSFTNYIENVYTKAQTQIRLFISGTIIVEGSLYNAMYLTRRPSGENLYGLVAIDNNNENVLLNYTDATAFTSGITNLFDTIIRIN